MSCFSSKRSPRLGHRRFVQQQTDTAIFSGRWALLTSTREAHTAGPTSKTAVWLLLTDGSRAHDTPLNSDQKVQIEAIHNGLEGSPLFRIAKP